MNILESIKRKLNPTVVEEKKDPEVDPEAKPLGRIYSDFTDDEWDIYVKVKPFTMTSPERVLSLIKAVEYITKSNVKGDIVECGVWKGGSIMAVIEKLTQLKSTERSLWLYDTFEGMSEPTNVDVDPDGNLASVKMATEEKERSRVWAYSGINEVKSNISLLNYPEEQVNFVIGKVEDTLVKTIPESISLLRLDTDWYESTKIELEVLYDKVVKGGVVIIDDYGHWEGCKKAVDEFIENKNIQVLLHRIDYTGRMFVKP